MAQKGEVTSLETRLKISEANFKHGHSHAPKGSPEYHTYACWIHFNTRCRNPLDRAYAEYGGRGLTVCNRWRSYTNFLNDMGLRPHGRTIERLDNDKGYSPDNCKWATKTEQARNRRSSRVVKVDEYAFTVAEWAERTGIKEGTVLWRVKRAERLGKPLTGKALFLPVGYSDKEVRIA